MNNTYIAGEFPYPRYLQEGSDTTNVTLTTALEIM